MRIAVKLVAVLSLMTCILLAVLCFLSHISHATYTFLFVVFSAVYFVAATTWAEMRH